MTKHFGYESEKFDYTFKKNRGSLQVSKIKTNESLIKARANTPITLPVHLESTHMPSAKKYVRPSAKKNREKLKFDSFKK